MASKQVMIHDVPNEERPRERMLQHGEQALSNAELLAILLRTGTFSESAVTLAQRLLVEAGGLRNIIDMNVQQLTQIKGIGPAKAIQIKSGIELGRRLAATSLDNKPSIRTPDDVGGLLMEEMRYLDKEHFVCLFLNTKNQVIARETLSVGSLNAAIVHPREVFKAAIKLSSASIICVHNHPSGDPTPSQEDISLTHRLAESGEIVGIEVLDHIVIGDNRLISLKQAGLM